MTRSAMLPVLVFASATTVSLAASAVLVTRLERVCARLSAPEAVLGLVVALAADGPEITSAVAALVSGQHDIGVGVVLGSNAFNLAALLGLAAIVARRIVLHRRVVVLEGAVAMWMAVASAATVIRLMPPAVTLALALAVLIPYVAISAVHPKDRDRLPLPARWRSWLAGAVSEEELEIANALRAKKGRPIDMVTALAALGTVIAASIAMERSASSIGATLGIPSAITGGLVLASVTSLPNAVAAIYLATHNRASATLSQALNSNTLNTVAGLLVPAAIAGVGTLSAAPLIIAGWYTMMTACTIVLALRGHGLSRGSGIAIVLIYVALTPVLLAL